MKAETAKSLGATNKLTVHVHCYNRHVAKSDWIRSDFREQSLHLLRPLGDWLYWNAIVNPAAPVHLDECPTNRRIKLRLHTYTISRP